MASIFGSGIDLIELTLPIDNIAIQERNGLLFQPYSHSAGEKPGGLVDTFPLVRLIPKKTTGESTDGARLSVPGRKAVLRTRDTNFRFEIVRGTPVHAVMQIVVPAYLRGLNTVLAARNDLVEAKSKIESFLRYCGIELDLGLAGITRLDVAFDLEVQQPFIDYIPIFSNLQYRDSRNAPHLYRTGLQFIRGYRRSGKEVVSIYDKGRQMKDKKGIELQTDSQTRIRIERQIYGAPKVCKLYGVTTYADLIDHYDDVVDKHRSFIIDRVIGNDAYTLNLELQNEIQLLEQRKGENEMTYLRRKWENEGFLKDIKNGKLDLVYQSIGAACRAFYADRNTANTTASRARVWMRSKRQEVLQTTKSYRILLLELRGAFEPVERVSKKKVPNHADSPQKASGNSPRRRHSKSERVGQVARGGDGVTKGPVPAKKRILKENDGKKCRKTTR